MATGGEEKVGYSLAKVGTLELENTYKSPEYMSIVVCQDKIVVLDSETYKVNIHRLHDGKCLAMSDRLESRPRDMCLMDAMTICVLDGDGLIKMMSIDSTDMSPIFSTTRRLRLQGVLDRYDSVVRFNNNLVVAGEKQGMMYWCIVSLEDGHVDTIHQICKGGVWCRVTTKDTIIYISCHAGYKSPYTGVYGFDILNPSQCKYTHKHRRLQNPTSIVINEDGNIFVCNPGFPDHYDYCIHQLTASCQLVAIFTKGIPWDLNALFWDNGRLYGTCYWSHDITVFRPVYQEGLIRRLMRSLGLGRSQKKLPIKHSQGSHKASEVLVSNKRKQPVIEERAIQTGQGNVSVDQGQSSVATEMPPSGPVPEDSEDDKQGPVIPVEILHMDDKSLMLYKEALRDGKEKVYNIRVMVVGQYGVGKTTLTKHLLGQKVDISERKSTEGIDVHKHCCKIVMDTGEWIVQNKDSDQLARLQRIVNLLLNKTERSEVSGVQEEHGEVMYPNNFSDSDEDDIPISRNVIYHRDFIEDDDVPNSSESDIHQNLDMISPELVRSGVTILENEKPESSIGDATMELIQLVNESSDKLNKSIEEYAALSIWDFAGQYVFYTTHQTFLTSRAIYLLVTDLSQQITDLVENDEYYFDTDGIKLHNVQDLVEVWLNSIHCCATSTAAGTTVASTAAGIAVTSPATDITVTSPAAVIKVASPAAGITVTSLAAGIIVTSPAAGTTVTPVSSPDAGIPSAPPVILVGTHVDKIKEDKRQEVIRMYFPQICRNLNNKPALHHVVKFFAIDNTKLDPQLQALKDKIFQLAKEQPYWGEEVPTSWIPMEEALMKLKSSGEKVIPLSLVEDLNQAASVPIKTAEQLDLFLRFQHEMGTILYFSVDGLREKIVLDPQWFIDALKSLITAEMFILEKYPAIRNKWFELKDTGKLAPELIDAIWTRENNPEFCENKKHLLLVMEKLNIIARPMIYIEGSEELKVENYFLAPCMLRQKTPAEVICPEPNDQLESSSVLCYVFMGHFMPSPIFHRLLAACIAHWPIATMKKEETQEKMIFCGCCVFQMDPYHKLTIHFREHVIYVRVTRMGIREKTPSSKMCIEVREFITTSLQKIIGHLCQSLKFEYFIQCPEYSGEGINTLIPVSLLKENAEVRCEFHDNIIESCKLLNFWFKEQDQSGDADDCIFTTLGAQDQAGNMKADIDQTEAVFVHEQLVLQAKSVGIIRSQSTSGTGFRVGPNYIMTAKHVVDDIIKGPPVPIGRQMQLNPHDRLNNRNVYIDFSYERVGVPRDENLRYYFEPVVVYANDNLDTAILKLQPDTKEYPPPLTTFNDVTALSQGRIGYLIGHSRADIKKTDKYQLYMPSQHEIKSARDWSMQHANVMNGYDGIDNPHCVLLNCSFEKGASGAPGFYISPDNGQAYLELMLLRGYPSWYYDDKYKAKTVGISNRYLIEQGVCMRSIYDDMKTIDASLCQEIFQC